MKYTLISALKTSGKTILEYFDKPVESKEKESQSSIVTAADFASDLIITKIIRDRFPEHNFISEETGFSNKNSEYTWVIDPLDGTSNFASGVPWFGILISLFKKGKFGACINLYTKIWDISGPGLIISEAGGIMKDIYGNDIQFSVGKDIVKKNFPVIAGSTEIVESLKKVLSY
ncbi:MAG: inositol-phosphate phosphatase [Bacteroidetes bacterium]|nr:inositol-phosphate phosphatase [Bacteroidota bacterium]